MKNAGDMVDGTDLVTIGDVTDPGVEDVVVLGEGNVLSDDEWMDDSDAAEYEALGDGALPKSLGDGEATESDEGVAVAVASDVMLLPCLPGGHSVLLSESAGGPRFQFRPNGN